MGNAYSSAIRNVFFRTPGKLLTLETRPNENIDELLKRYRIPLNAISLFVKYDNCREKLITTFEIRAIKKSCDIIIQPVRNINYSLALQRNVTEQIEQDSTTEWIFPTDIGAYDVCHKSLSAQECFDIAYNFVEKTLGEIRLSGEKIVVGISGGGDSNALLKILTSTALIRKDQIKAAMLLGIPEWDPGLKTAAEMCQNYGIDFEPISPTDGMKFGGFCLPTDKMLIRFLNHFPKDDIEVFGTFAIRRILSGYAAKIGSTSIVLGQNREDILSDYLLCVMKGMAPLKYPNRVISGINFIYPMWQIPKKILDGIFPKKSIENYENRGQSHGHGRFSVYYLASMIGEMVPGADLDLINGFSIISEMNENPYRHNWLLDDIVFNDAKPETIKRWSNFLKGELK